MTDRAPSAVATAPPAVPAPPGGTPPLWAPTILALDEVGSTNDEAMARALAGDALPLWVTAVRQTAGRGRADRAWQSAAGNLHASLAFAPTCPMAALPQLSLVAGVAVAEAVRAVAITAGRPDLADAVRLKWPNDILIDGGQIDGSPIEGGKMGGILVETTTRGQPPAPSSSTDPQGLLVAVIGIGLDLVATPAIPDRQTTMLAAHGAHLEPLDALRAISERLGAVLRTWQGGAGFAHVARRWLACATPVGAAITVTSGARTRQGRFAGLDDDGALLLEIGAGVVDRVTFGDVMLIGPAGART